MANPDGTKKVLAIAVMRDGKVVNKLIPGSQAVQIGTGYNNNIVLEGTRLPATMNFLSSGEEKDSWVIRLSDDMDATVTSTDGAKLNFRDLKGLGIFPTDDDGFYLLNLKYLDQDHMAPQCTEINGTALYPLGDPDVGRSLANLCVRVHHRFYAWTTANGTGSIRSGRRCSTDPGPLTSISVT